jgi:hypothetical protein
MGVNVYRNGIEDLNLLLLYEAILSLGSNDNDHTFTRGQ